MLYPQRLSINITALIALNSLKNSVHGFFIGRSFNDDKRQLCGNIAEVRIWSVARTQQEIWDNMYSVDPQTEGLAAYWKFDTPIERTSPRLTASSMARQTSRFSAK